MTRSHTGANPVAFQTIKVRKFLRLGCGSCTMAPKDVHVLAPRTCDEGSLRGKGDLAAVSEAAGVLGGGGGPEASEGAYKRGTGRQKVKRTLGCCPWGWREAPSHGRQVAGARRGQDSLQKEQGPAATR